MNARRRALLSVSDKSGLEDFARGLAGLGFELLSTGGTAATLRAAALEVVDVSAVTGYPEIMDGRVKTLHPAIHGALLGRRGIDEDVAEAHGIEFINLLVVNLYPFEHVTSRRDCSVKTAIETIDVGGPAMIRAAAKNHARVIVVVDADDYGSVLQALAADAVTADLRQRLAIKAFTHTASYDAAISSYFSSRLGSADPCPETYLLAARRALALRYGENPHQAAALYRTVNATTGAVAHAIKLQGKTLSYNNIADADAAVQCVKAFEDAACVIVKHANPCGVAVAADAREAYRRAYDCDPTSAFGGIIAFNRTLDRATAHTIVEQQFAEVIAAPRVDPDAMAELEGKQNIRVLELGEMSPARAALEVKTIEGGALVQERDLGSWVDTDRKIVTRRKPTEQELVDLRFAWTVAKFVKSNAIVYAADSRTIGIGAGQMSRVVSAKIAALKADEAGLGVGGAVMASDAFFPFRDGIDAAAERGIRAIVQPGGALRDEEIIAAADEHGMAMVFTGMRHFRH
jgi:phosphoribosylaminoimidazolecarboxamide formyltransferase/IMP cyclohydrolase